MKMGRERDPYEVLGVPRDATFDQIRRKYRKLLRKFHPNVVAPDRDPEMVDYANRMTAEINAAWETFRDRDGRAKSRSKRSRRARFGVQSFGRRARQPKRARFLLTGGLAAGATALLAVVIVVTILLVWPAGSNGGGPSAGEPSGADKEAIESLARRSIEVLPEGEWSSLYDSFTSEFQQRCPRAEFEQGGRDASIELGGDLATLRFKRLEELSVEGGTAQANIVGEVGGDTEYAIQAAFRKIEDGSWRLAPAPGTSGCAAFNRLDTVGAGS